MDTLKPGNAVPPKVEKGKTYRPPGSLIHRVSDGENWAKLAARYKRDASKIIDDNFGTTNPYEVNWYLQEYVKCDQATPDRYNWRFSTSSRNRGGFRPGIIFIVPNWFAILDAAKFLAKKAIIQWFTSAFLPATPVHGSVYKLRGEDIGWLPSFLLEFERSLTWQGATDELAAAWAKAVHQALRDFSFSISSETNIPVPHLVPGYNQVPGNVPLSWNGLQKASAGTTAFMEIANCDGISMNDAQARQAILNFSQWWQQRLESVAQNTVTQVTVSGTYIVPQQMWNAATVPTSGFIRGVETAVNLPG